MKRRSKSFSPRKRMNTTKSSPTPMIDEYSCCDKQVSISTITKNIFDASLFVDKIINEPKMIEQAASTERTKWWFFVILKDNRYWYSFLTNRNIFILINLLVSSEKDVFFNVKSRAFIVIFRALRKRKWFSTIASVDFLFFANSIHCEKIFWFTHSFIELQIRSDDVLFSHWISQLQLVLVIPSDSFLLELWNLNSIPMRFSLQRSVLSFKTITMWLRLFSTKDLIIANLNSHQDDFLFHVEC